MSIWTEIRNDYEEDGIIFIDAWETDDDESQGSVIAKVNIDTKEVSYKDERAKTDVYAQEMILEVINVDKTSLH